MRHYLNLIIICFFSCNTDSSKMKKTDLVDFTDIQIQFITGDEVKVLYKMHIFKENDKVKALKQKTLLLLWVKN